MAISSYSTTAADNDGLGIFDEGQAPNTVNDGGRDLMADVRAFYENIEWRDWGHTVTRTGNTTFTISSASDLSSVYMVGRRIRCTDSSTLYGTISVSSYASSTQTVTVSLDSGSLSASLSAVSLGFDPTNNPVNGSIFSWTGYSGSISAHKNLQVKYATVATVDIDSDDIVLEYNNLQKIVSSVNLTVDITASGANGLDTGVEANSTWSYVWVISNGQTTAGILSASATSPTMPSGYVWKGLVGAIYNNSSGDFINIHQRNTQVSAEIRAAVSSGVATSSTSIANFDTFIPSIATRWLAQVDIATSTSGNFWAQLEASSSLGRTILGDTNPSASAIQYRASTSVYVATAQQAYYRVNAGTTAATIYVSGWEY